MFAKQIIKHPNITFSTNFSMTVALKYYLGLWFINTNLTISSECAQPYNTRLSALKWENVDSAGRKSNWLDDTGGAVQPIGSKSGLCGNIT